MANGNDSVNFLENPELVASLALDALGNLLARVKALEGMITARLLAGTAVAIAQSAAIAPRGTEGDKPLLLTAQEAAQLLGVTKIWVYRHARELRAIRLGAGVLRFSRDRLLAYVRVKQEVAESNKNDEKCLAAHATDKH